MAASGLYLAFGFFPPEEAFWTQKPSQFLHSEYLTERQESKELTE